MRHIPAKNNAAFYAYRVAKHGHTIFMDTAPRLFTCAGHVQVLSLNLQVLFDCSPDYLGERDFIFLGPLGYFENVPISEAYCYAFVVYHINSYIVRAYA